MALALALALGCTTTRVVHPRRACAQARPPPTTCGVVTTATTVTTCHRCHSHCYHRCRHCHHPQVAAKAITVRVSHRSSGKTKFRVTGFTAMPCDSCMFELRGDDAGTVVRGAPPGCSPYSPA